jgi:hypothetical protein
VEVAGESVAEGSEGLVVVMSGGSLLVVEVSVSGAGLERAEGPVVDGVIEAPVAYMSCEHGPSLS